MALPAYSGGNTRGYQLGDKLYFFEFSAARGFYLRQGQNGDACFDCSDGQSFRDYCQSDDNLIGDTYFRFIDSVKALAVELPSQAEYEQQLKEGKKMSIETGVQSTKVKTLSDALEYCKSLGDGWRLPNKAELESLYGKVSFTGDYYWTGDNDLYGELEDVESDFYGESKVWVMDSETGNMYYDHIENGFYVIPVK